MMKTYKSHPYTIDDVDLGKIINKSNELEQIVTWLKKLKMLDKTVDTVALDKAITDLTRKKHKLDRKAKRAISDMTEEAELINALYTSGD